MSIFKEIANSFKKPSKATKPTEIDFYSCSKVIKDQQEDQDIALEDISELIKNNNGIISSRQRSYKYTNAALFEKLTCIKSVNNNFTYFVYNNNERFTWIVRITL